MTNSIVQGGYTGTGNLDADPLLGPLRNNGGFTETMALGTGSPAIDAGDNGVCPTTDQRGVTRQLESCDIGAYEYEIIAPTFSDVPFSHPYQPIHRDPVCERIHCRMFDLSVQILSGCDHGSRSILRLHDARQLRRFLYPTPCYTFLQPRELESMHPGQRVGQKPCITKVCRLVVWHLP